MNELRLDLYLVENGFFQTREKARFAILKGAILVNHKIAQKPSIAIKPTDKVSIIEDEVNPYVSKGGLKLKKAIEVFNLDFNNKNVLDIGASTGGFTDCALQHGAKLVVSVDVGNGQLDPSLLDCPSIISIEDKDIRDLTLEEINIGYPDFIVSDISFISLTLVMRQFAYFMSDSTQLVVLIKPQFEAGKEQLGSDGIVKNPKTHEKVIRLVEKSANQNGLAIIKLTSAPIFELKKNIEYLALLVKKPQIQPVYALNLITEAFEFQKKIKKS